MIIGPKKKFGPYLVHFVTLMESESTYLTNKHTLKLVIIHYMTHGWTTQT